jgi:transposase
VICFDEFGPIEVRPYHGRAWRRVRHPARLRATYRRLHGTRQYLAAYDVADNRLMMRCYRRKRCREVLLFLTHIRSRYPVATRLYLVLDNFSPHKRPEVRDWAADHNVELVFTPTYASWLNRIEAIFSGVRYFALDNSDYRDHEQSRRAILAYVAWRNRHRHTALVKRREKHKMSFATRH